MPLQGQSRRKHEKGASRSERQKESLGQAGEVGRGSYAEKTRLDTVNLAPVFDRLNTIP